MRQLTATALPGEGGAPTAPAMALAEALHTTFSETIQVKAIFSVVDVPLPAATRARHLPTQAASGIVASGIANVAPRTCQMLTAIAVARNARTITDAPVASRRGVASR